MYEILVVEDDKNTNQVICEFLKEAGYGVTSVYDGESAIFCFTKIGLTWSFWILCCQRKTAWRS